MRDPQKRKANDLKYRTTHREERNSYAREYNVSNRDSIKVRKITNYDRLFEFDAGTTQWALDVTDSCGVCGDPFNASGALGKAVDHNHATSRFRGIVHQRCNTVLGQMKDSEDLCLKAAAYLHEAA